MDSPSGDVGTIPHPTHHYHFVLMWVVDDPWCYALCGCPPIPPWGPRVQAAGAYSGMQAHPPLTRSRPDSTGEVRVTGNTSTPVELYVSSDVLLDLYVVLTTMGAVITGEPTSVLCSLSSVRVTAMGVAANVWLKNPPSSWTSGGFLHALRTSSSLCWQPESEATIRGCPRTSRPPPTLGGSSTSLAAATWGSRASR